MKELRKAITDTIQISEKVLNEFVSCWKKVSYSKGTIISKPDYTDRYLHFTLSGIQKAYYLIDGKQNIVSFTQSNHFSCAPDSFLTQTPSKYYFECITQSEFLRLSHEDFLNQTRKHIEIQEFLTISLMGLVNNITDRFIKQTSLSIEEKFKDFMKENLQLINQIPHKDIACYLSMNPTNFSKLLNKVVIK